MVISYHAQVTLSKPAIRQLRNRLRLVAGGFVGRNKVEHAKSN
jgi:hypothetical protein